MTGVSMIQSSMRFINFALSGEAIFGGGGTSFVHSLHCFLPVYHQVEHIRFYKGVLLLFRKKQTTLSLFAKVAARWKAFGGLDGFQTV